MNNANLDPPLDTSIQIPLNDTINNTPSNAYNCGSVDSSDDATEDVPNIDPNDPNDFMLTNDPNN
ncbi:hypothetical protein HK096_008303, partial [Nowakowskiella sp. JEL0078]